jgi:hypothetical protein
MSGLVKNKVIISLLCCSLWLVIGVSGREQNSSKRLLGDSGIAAVDQVIARLYPGAHLQWGDRIEFVDSAGKHSQFMFSGFTNRKIKENEVYFTGLLFPDRVKALAKSAAEFSVGPEIPQATRFAVFQTDENGKLVDLHVIPLEQDSLFDEIVNINVLPSDKPSDFPSVYLEYSSVYSNPSWYGTIRWNSVIDTATMRVTRKVPLFLSKNTKGGIVKTDQLEIQKAVLGKQQLKGKSSGKTIDYDCSDICSVYGSLILKNW